jgi:thiamine biosynthesis lipoprotein
MRSLRTTTTAVLIALLATTAPSQRSASGSTAASRPQHPVVSSEPLTLEGNAFGQALHIEVPAGPTAEKALLDALRAIQVAESEMDPSRGALADLNASAGDAHATSATLRATLARALDFCRWSEGTNGPLGGELYVLWGLRTVRPALPDPQAVRQAAAIAAACDGLKLDDAKGTATLANGVRVDLWGFAAGAALDRAVDALAAHGVRDASLTLGAIQRGVGAGPGGRGWPLRVEVPPFFRGFTSAVLLKDQSFAVAAANDAPMRAGGESYAPYLDMRTGRPVGGVLSTVTITQLALDAQALAATLFVTGTRRGGFLLGKLTPTPAALWAIGDGQSEPIVSDFRWGTRQRRGSR